MKTLRTITQADIKKHVDNSVIIRPDMTLQGDILYDIQYAIELESENGAYNLKINKIKEAL